MGNPDDNLARQREILAEWRELEERMEVRVERGVSSAELADERYDLAVELSALSEEMDEWLSGGGYLPVKWRRAKSPG